MREFTAVSLFCGAGGLDLGFEQAGFRTIWANDFDKDACKTHQNWSKAKVFCGDISKVNIDDIPSSDIVLGGFPCQGFSLSGPRKIDDSRNVLYKHYVNIVRKKQPKIFVGENVKGLLTMGDGKIFEAIVQEFSDCGSGELAPLPQHGSGNHNHWRRGLKGVPSAAPGRFFYGCVYRGGCVPAAVCGYLFLGIRRAC